MDASACHDKKTAKNASAAYEKLKARITCANSRSCTWSWLSYSSGRSTRVLKSASYLRAGTALAREVPSRLSPNASPRALQVLALVGHRLNARRRESISNDICPISRRQARSSFSTVAGTTAPASSGSWDSAQTRRHSTLSSGIAGAVEKSMVEVRNHLAEVLAGSERGRADPTTGRGRSFPDSRKIWIACRRWISGPYDQSGMSIDSRGKWTRCSRRS